MIAPWTWLTLASCLAIPGIGFAGTPGVEKPRPALHLAVTDLDRDGDLDIIFTPVLGRAEVPFWVNDGAGRFKHRHVRRAPVPELPSSHAVEVAPPRVDTLATLPASPRADSHLWMAARGLAPAHDGSSALPPLNTPLHRSLPEFSFVSRAPPAPTPIL